MLKEVFGLQKEQVLGDWKGLGECNLRGVMVCTVREIRQMDRACGRNGEDDICVQSFGGET
jgi:hypothetical protein